MFEIEELDPERVLFIQREVFKGLLVPLLARSLDRDTARLRGDEPSAKGNGRDHR